ncbi:conjugal transfer protein TraM, partial [Campylobacter coli]|nr:conjugal transfer protein TraM [Campylobacter coli]
MNKKELIEEIAKKHHIILDENDPILAVVSANEIIFDDFLKKIDLLFIKHKTDLE